MTANPRMALSSHLEGVMNGLFLLALGALWEQVRLSSRMQKTVYCLAIYGTFVNWETTLLAPVLGAGGSMMPIAAGDFVGTSAQEVLITAGLLSLSFAMLIVCPILFWGFRRFPIPQTGLGTH